MYMWEKVSFALAMKFNKVDSNSNIMAWFQLIKKGGIEKYLSGSGSGYRHWRITFLDRVLIIVIVLALVVMLFHQK